MKLLSLPLHITAGLTLALGLATALGCNDIAKGITDKIIEGQTGNPDGNTNKPPEKPDTPHAYGSFPGDPPRGIDWGVLITNLTPGRGSKEGGDLIEIIGYGFSPDMIVYFMPTSEACAAVAAGTATLDATLACADELEAGVDRILPDPAFLTIEPNRVTCKTPAVTEPMFASIVIRVDPTPTGPDKLRAAAIGAFEYFEPIRLSGFNPTRGPSAGGTLVTVSGSGFTDDAIIVFGSTAPVSTHFINKNTLELVTPKRPAGSYTVAVVNRYDAEQLPDAFRFYDPVRVAGVAPFAGPMGGGTAVTVTGTGFVAPTGLSFGGQPMAATTRLDERAATSTTLPALPPREGPVDVTAINVYGANTLKNGFVYVDENNSTPRVVWVSPAASGIDGGQTVEVVYGGYSGDGTGLTVTIGGQPATCVPDGAFVLRCTTPAGLEGPAVVAVSDGQTLASWSGDYRFVDLRVDALVPARGAQAGGTWVKVSGHGFAPGTVVLVGGEPALEVHVLSGDELTLRTPPGVPGSVPVTVVSLGIETTIDDAFTYFDPFALDTWVSGDEIEGAVNVQVFSGPSVVSGALVVVGDRIDPSRPYLYGHTNEHGEVTISGPDVLGPLNLHGTKAGYGGFSIIQIDRENVMLQLRKDPPPQQDPLPPCPEPEPGASRAPSLVTGRIYRIKDEWNTGDDTVVVTTTYSSGGEGMPDPGPKSTMIAQGDYEMLSRTGDVMLIALAGYPTEDSYLDVHAMGFHPFLYIEPSSGASCTTTDAPFCPMLEKCLAVTRLGLTENTPNEGVCLRVYENIDIVIDTPRNQPMAVEIHDAPFLRPDEVSAGVLGPNAIRTTVYYDFGYQGYFPIEIGLQVSATDVLYIDMPKELPEALGLPPFQVNLSLGYQEYYQQTDSWSFQSPYSETTIRGVDTRVPLQAGLRTVKDGEDPNLIGPFPNTHVPKVFPGDGTSVVDDAIRFCFDLRPPDLPLQPITAGIHYIYHTDWVLPCAGAPTQVAQTSYHWIVATPGTTTAFVIPEIPAELEPDANIPDGEHVWYMFNNYSPQASWRDFDLGALSDWKSRAQLAIYITVAR